MKINIIGGGVCGLSCGILLLQLGHEVTITSEKWSPDTTSDIAAAIWYPFTVNPPDRVTKWGSTTFSRLNAIYQQQANSGIILVKGYDLYGEDEPEPLWKDTVFDYRRAPLSELPPGYKSGFFFSTFVIDMSYYMPWLITQYKSLGGHLYTKRVVNIEDGLRNAEILINCSGLGAKELCNDENAYPIRGQVLKIDSPKVEHFYLDFKNGPNKLSYIIPRINNCIIGGTTEINNWDLNIDNQTSESIHKRCSNILPSLEKANIVSCLVGLRPGRSEVCLEKDNSFSKPVIHNYGHGGAGVTISWGCAEEVCQLVDEFFM